MPPARFELLRFRRYPEAEMEARAAEFYAEMDRRRTVRHFSDAPVPPSVIDNALRTAGTAPSGAHLQPWHFVVVRDGEAKARIRQAAEAEEAAFYNGRAPQDWLDALAPLGTDASKPFLETAPCLIAIFAQPYGVGASGKRMKHYYVSESVGIATGLLVAALHHAGLATLTHTPSPMGFLGALLGRPAHERPYLLLVAGYPAGDAAVPALTRKPLGAFVTYR